MRGTIKVIICLCFLFANTDLLAEEFPISAISEDLKKDANAVIRYEENSFIQTDLNNATEKITKVITIFNDNGKDMADIVIPQGKFLELKNFSGEIYLASGKLFTKIAKKDLTATAYSSHLASDDSYSYYSPSVPSYPYTIKYTYEVKWKNGLAHYPTFVPVPEFECAVEKSILKLQVPAAMSVRFKKNDLVKPPTRSLMGMDSVIMFTCENFNAIVREPMCPSYSELVPVVFAAPTSFCFDKVSGDMSSWQGVGLFLTELQKGRTTLLPETITKIQQMTASVKDEKEKVKILYEYLQDKTRYVSIQLGIGGWQPISAEQVDKTGFGDCKALVNYMKAMLSAVNIPSEYAIIHTTKKRMFPDFSTPNQANHAVLLVPLKNDSIWLECTSRDLPCGYLHDGMAGHDVLLVSGEQSAICTIPVMPDSLNTEINVISLKLSPDGTATSSVKNIYNNHEMEGLISFVLYKPEKEKINDLAESLSVNKVQISNIKTNYHKAEYPKVTISYDMQAEKYATLTGRMFVPLNPFRNQWSRNFSSTTRKLPIHIQSTVNQTDSIYLELPAGYSIESSPKPITLKSEFGTFSSSIEISGNHLVVEQKIYIHPGRYAPESYVDLKAFFKEVDTCLAGRVVLKKD